VGLVNESAETADRFIVGYLDTINEMHAVCNRSNGHATLSVDALGWRLVE
jgi:hypothetical protein